MAEHLLHATTADLSIRTTDQTVMFRGSELGTVLPGETWPQACRRLLAKAKADHRAWAARWDFSPSDELSYRI